MKLIDMVNVIQKDCRCVILEVKPNMKMNLISLDGFNGDETMIRVSKDRDDTITIWTNDKHYSWERGTLVTESMNTKRHLIMELVRSL